MKLPFFTTFLIFIAILTIQLKRTDGKERKNEEDFWAREHRANFTRKKDIDHLPYIDFHPADLPMHSELEDPMVSEYIAELSRLEGTKILNCTGQSNTDLKLKYGAANITKLSEYDQNYTVLVRDLARLAEKYLLWSARLLPQLNLEDTENAPQTGDQALMEKAAALKADARTILEYGISVDTDVRLNYELLAQLYASQGDYAAIARLKEKAQSLNSLSKDPILRSLDKILPV